MNEWEKVKIVRCVKDPMLPGQKPKQAIFVPDIPDCEVNLHIPTGNVWFHFEKFKRTMMIGVGNIEMVETYWRDDGKVEDSGRETKENEPTPTRGPGRPRKD